MPGLSDSRERLVVKHRQPEVVAGLALTLIVTGIFVHGVWSTPGIAIDVVLITAIAVVVCGIGSWKMLTRVVLRRDQHNVLIERSFLITSEWPVAYDDVAAVDVVKGGFYFDHTGPGAGRGYRVRIVRRAGKPIALTTLGTRNEASELQQQIEAFLGLASSAT